MAIIRSITQMSKLPVESSQCSIRSALNFFLCAWISNSISFVLLLVWRPCLSWSRCSRARSRTCSSWAYSPDLTSEPSGAWMTSSCSSMWMWCPAAIARTASGQLFNLYPSTSNEQFLQIMSCWEANATRPWPGLLRMTIIIFASIELNQYLHFDYCVACLPMVD